MRILRSSRYVWAAVVLLVTAGVAIVLADPDGSTADPADLRAQIERRMRTTLEQVSPEQHNHGGHQIPTTGGAEPSVVCGVRVYGYEPAEVKTLAGVRTVYGFHLCGVAEPQRPWDVAVKLAGPVIVDMAVSPPGIQVVEATAETKYIDRLHEMFPPRYADLAMKEALADTELKDLRRRYNDAAGL
ncbi:hypothetical protein Ait01nite_099580 [Actinoplanes italicus]|uniref:Uncharacterized protein n=1 Tax=Actinoplanes italicus TaxID=113567 RepID=A0A2T0KGG5_9ACTN|nr:hypothetical protein [Actinoplanes italicus]PRX22498.1 hypothetical protein CLV67_10414 [Actinoplanes italicus]GIE36913.1 hypothetical protein Ait01nite_099580 [Actinoplanes italicus]